MPLYLYDPVLYRICLRRALLPLQCLLIFLFQPLHKRRKFRRVIGLVPDTPQLTQ